ncbi:RTA1 like protein family [Tothia fuscella]|uniref:RTA1 like protein family n=1 Tax=Tothia fuscella TaxID=1048955 RepID=A0A9P4TYM1_9PEZI|nr:RTA1 like protein family [Tothia fuscella]
MSFSNATAPLECFSENFNTRKACRQACTFETCGLRLSYWAYLPSIAANGLFTGLFSLSLALFLIQAIYSRRFVAFSVSMLCGSVLEVLGYVGRVMSYHNPFGETGFLLQIICLTIAPAFYAAGIYFCLSRIVETFGAENSRLRPILYPRIFITCDFLSLVLQAMGGGMASAASHADKDPTTGNNIMIAGLAIQVATLTIFIALSADFAYSTIKRIKAMGKEQALDSEHAQLRSSFKFKGFIIALTFATLCIFTRSIYRVAELSEGWNGHLISTQRYFIGLEGAIVAAGILSLNAFHPGICFQEGYKEKKTWFARKSKASVSETSQEEAAQTGREMEKDS